MGRAIDELEFLSKAALALGELGQEEDVYAFVAEQLVELAPDTLVVTSSYDAAAGSTTVRAMAGPPAMLARTRELLGHDPGGLVFQIDDEARQALSDGKLMRIGEGLHQLTFRRWPKELAHGIEAQLGLRSVHAQPFSRKGDFLGTVALVSRARSLEHARLIETFVRLAAVAIQRRRVEAQLRESERRFRMLAENSRDVVFRLHVRPGLRFEYVSPATVRLCGRTPDEIYREPRLGAPCLFPEEWTEGVLRGVPIEPVVAFCRRHDGVELWTEQSFSPIRDGSGNVVAVEGIVRDVTKRKEAELAMLEADRRKTEFLAVLSHELRNPLGSIRNGVYVLGRTEHGSDQAKRALAIVVRQIAHLTRLVDDLLDVTRITRGKIQLQRERLDLGELVRGAIEDHRSMFANGGVEIEVIPARSGVFLVADRTRIGQVIANLLQNAAKFTPPGGRASMSFAADETRREALLRVHNTGPRIPPEVLARMFEPFVQADRTLDRSKGGLGLGLALVKGLVEMHAGSVEVESDDARGTTFTVRLPLDTTSPGVVVRAPEGPREETAHRRVLVIEDNADAADSLREALELHENKVAVASTGPEGIATARTFKPDVVVCDIGLPAFDGYQVARAMRADPDLRSLPLVALTGYASPEDVAHSREAGFDRHLAKPPEIGALERVIGELAPR